MRSRGFDAGGDCHFCKTIFFSREVALLNERGPSHVMLDASLSVLDPAAAVLCLLSYGDLLHVRASWFGRIPCEGWRWKAFGLWLFVFLGCGPTCTGWFFALCSVPLDFWAVPDYWRAASLDGCSSLEARALLGNSTAVDSVFLTAAVASTLPRSSMPHLFFDCYRCRRIFFSLQSTARCLFSGLSSRAPVIA